MFLLLNTHNSRGVAALAGNGAHGQLAVNDQNGDRWINLGGTWTKITDGVTGPVGVAIVTNGTTVTLQKSDSTTSTGNATLNSPATIIVSGGVVTAVRASA